MSSTVTPSIIPAKRTFAPAFVAPVVPTEPPAQIAVVLDQTSYGKVTLGLVRTTEVHLHDGVVKAKHLRPGQQVQAWLHGGPKGAVKTVATVTPVEEGAYVEVTFSTPHPTAVVKAAYRFYDGELDGTPIERTVTRRGFVSAR